jgi:Fe-S cluster assembly protein SufD
VTVAESPAVAGAVETTDRVASHLHPTGSFDVDAHAVPTGREEVWRFTPLRRLRDLHREAPIGPLGSTTTVEVEAPDEVTVRTVGADDPARGSSGYVPSDRIAARAWASTKDATVVTLPSDTIVEHPVIVRHRGVSLDGAEAGHLVLEAEQHSNATVVLVFEGSAVLADTVEVVVGEGAHLTVVSVQDWADDAVHISAQHARVGRDATLRHVAVSFGGELVRMSTSVEYDGPGGQAELLGLYFADEGQHLEHRLFVDHNAPKTRSNVDYKGALQGEGAHAVWIGDVLIRKVAEGIDTYESNRNLVLTDGCQADSVPNLEIETGEIEGAGHASTTGRFDDQQLFYLQSRGIPEDEARRLVVHGFFADIVRKIGVPAIEERLLETVEAELEKNVTHQASA